jgi:hypothetical protein
VVTISMTREKGGITHEPIQWNDGEYDASHHASNVGVKIRHLSAKHSGRDADGEYRAWLAHPNQYHLPSRFGFIIAPSDSSRPYVPTLRYCKLFHVGFRWCRGDSLAAGLMINPEGVAAPDFRLLAGRPEGHRSIDG